MAETPERIVAGEFNVLTDDPMMKAVLRRLASTLEECQLLRNQLDAAPQDFSKTPDPRLAGAVPLVLYFATREAPANSGI